MIKIIRSRDAQFPFVIKGIAGNSPQKFTLKAFLELHQKMSDELAKNNDVEIVEKVKKILHEKSCEPKTSIRRASKFKEDLGMDSLDLVEAIMAVEDEFDIEIDDADADKMKIVQDCVDYLTTKVS